MEGRTKRVMFDDRGAEASDSLSMNDAEDQLAVWLDWTVNSLDKSPLVAAMIGNHVEMIELLEKLKPDLMAHALSTKIKFVDINMILFCAQNGCNTFTVDYLLSKNLSLEKRDSNRVFLLHLAVKKGNVDLVTAILDYLSATAIPTFLQMRDADGQTPLHCAVRRSFTRITKVVLDASKFVPSSSPNSSSCVVITARPFLHL
ncbi:hypothetical protein CVT25_009155 [Psilocybe cyanescens]|uniref:Uncharacterized protein n=1 Tax=Psilocybe cyanescens TaxID=93625 RepID=A0A409XDU1_PSICY|nr:hypothetical protein CVT25_009155 [Psilocybe cyanescens]